MSVYYSPGVPTAIFYWVAKELQSVCDLSVCILFSWGTDCHIPLDGPAASVCALSFLTFSWRPTTITVLLEGSRASVCALNFSIGPGGLRVLRFVLWVSEYSPNGPTAIFHWMAQELQFVPRVSGFDWMAPNSRHWPWHTHTHTHNTHTDHFLNAYHCRTCRTLTESSPSRKKNFVPEFLYFTINYVPVKRFSSVFYRTAQEFQFVPIRMFLYSAGWPKNSSLCLCLWNCSTVKSTFSAVYNNVFIKLHSN